MGRRPRGALDELMESWARWCQAGKVVPGCGTSMIGKMMDNQGLMHFGGGPRRDPLVECVEARIEAVVVTLASEAPEQADVLRLEYGAGVREVVQRLGLRGYDPRTAGQFETARALGMSLRTYRRRLAAARAKLEQGLDDGPP